MRKDRDERLNKAMGFCIHDFQCIGTSDADRCIHCGINEDFAGKQIDFSTGDGFMILWEWATHSNERWNTGDKYGDFWIAFCKVNRGGYINGFMTVHRGLIHPDRFADALDKYLHGENDE